MSYYVKKVLRFFLPIGSGENIGASKGIILGAQRVHKQLKERASSLPNICIAIENAKNKNDLKVAFGRLNDVMSTLTLIAPLTEPNGIVSQVLHEFKFSKKFEFYLRTAPTPEEAILSYKTAVTKALSVHHRKMESFLRQQDIFENALFDKYFPPTFGAPSQIEGTGQHKLEDLCESVLSPFRKRTFRKCMESGTILYSEMSPEIKPDKTRKMSSSRKRRRFTN